MTAEWRPRLRENLVVRQVEEDVVVYDPVFDRTALLNFSAAVILELCDGSRTTREITRDLSITFSLETREVTTDVDTVLGILVGAGLLHAANNVVP